MILLKSLQLHNFLSHKDTTIDFAPNERVLLDGKSGAGKSSVVEGLTWALFNKGRVQSRSLVKRGATEAYAKLVLTHDKTGADIEIVRRINTKGTHQVQVSRDGEPIAVAGTKNIQDYIEKELIKCSYSLFINSVCYPQENLDSFVRQTPANRKNLILELVQAQLYDTYYEKVRDKVGETKERLNFLVQQIVQWTTDADIAKMKASELPALQAEEIKIRTELDEVNADLKTADEEYLTQHTTSTRIQAIEGDLTRLRTEAQRQLTIKKQYEAKATELNNLNTEEIVTKHEEYEILYGDLEQLTQWEQKFGELKTNAPSLPNYRELIPQTSAELARAEENSRTVPEELCTVCSATHPCGLIGAERAKHMESLKVKLADYNAKQAQYDTAEATFLKSVKELEGSKPAFTRAEINAKLLALKPAHELFFKLEGQEQLKTQYLEEAANADIEANQIIEQGKILASQKDELLKTINLEALGQRRSDLTIRSSQLTIQVNDLTYRRGVAEAAGQTVKVLEDNIKGAKEEQTSLKENNEGLLLLKDAFGPNGIKAIVVDYVIPQLEDRINAILGQLSPFQIRLNTQKSNIEGDSTIEGLFISIINDQGEEFDYDSYSGGQKTKIMFAIAEGLAELQKMAFRILDEAVIGLDEDTGKEFAETIMALSSRFQQLICVSHVREIKELFEKQLLIVNRNGDSEIL